MRTHKNIVTQLDTLRPNPRIWSRSPHHAINRMKIRIVYPRIATQKAVLANDNALSADDLTVAHASIRPNLKVRSRSDIDDASSAATHWVPATP
jgi:hypothetical protein